MYVIYLCVCMYACMYVCNVCNICYVCVCMYLYMYVFMCVIYVCMYVHFTVAFVPGDPLLRYPWNTKTVCMYV
jgi:hypothetical protein